MARRTQPSVRVDDSPAPLSAVSGEPLALSSPPQDDGPELRITAIALCEIYAGRQLHAGDEIPEECLAGLTEGEHYTR